MMFKKKKWAFNLWMFNPVTIYANIYDGATGHSPGILYDPLLLYDKEG